MRGDGNNNNGWNLVDINTIQCSLLPFVSSFIVNNGLTSSECLINEN